MVVSSQFQASQPVLVILSTVSWLSDLAGGSSHNPLALLFFARRKRERLTEKRESMCVFMCVCDRERERGGPGQSKCKRVNLTAGAMLNLSSIQLCPPLKNACCLIDILIIMNGDSCNNF